MDFQVRGESNVDFSGAELKLLNADDKTARIRCIYNFEGFPDAGDITMILGSDTRRLVDASK